MIWNVGKGYYNSWGSDDGVIYHHFSTMSGIAPLVRMQDAFESGDSFTIAESVTSNAADIGVMATPAVVSKFSPKIGASQTYIQSKNIRVPSGTNNVFQPNQGVLSQGTNWPGKMLFKTPSSTPPIGPTAEMAAIGKVEALVQSMQGNKNFGPAGVGAAFHNPSGWSSSATTTSGVIPPYTGELLWRLENRVGPIGSRVNRNIVGNCVEPRSAFGVPLDIPLDELGFTPTYRPSNGRIIEPCPNCKATFPQLESK